MLNRDSWTIQAVGAILTGTNSFAEQYLLSKQRETRQRELNDRISIDKILVASSAVAALISAYSAVTKLFSDASEGLPDFSASDIPDDGSSLFSIVEKWLTDRAKALSDLSTRPTPVPTTAPAAPVVSGASTWPASAPEVKSKASVATYLSQAAAHVGVDPQLLFSVAKVESSFRESVVNPITGATGLFQFLPSTWNFLIKKFHFLNFKSSDINDPQKNSVMGALYLKSIADTLTKALGRSPSPSEVYLGHFLGPTGAVKFLKALNESPATPANVLFPRAARANPSLFTRQGTAKSFDEVWKTINNKFVAAYNSVANYARADRVAPVHETTSAAYAAVDLPPVSMSPIDIPDNALLDQLKDTPATTESAQSPQGTANSSTKTWIRNRSGQLISINPG